MNNQVKNAVDFFQSVCEETEGILHEYKFEENLQFPVLLTMVISRLKIDPKKAKEVDPFIRYYVRNHPEFYVSRGAKGGIMPIAHHRKKLDAKAAKDAAKKQIEAQLAAKVAPAPSSPVVADDSDNSLDDTEADSLDNE